jgi:hypothetical protein
VKEVDEVRIPWLQLAKLLHDFSMKGDFFQEKTALMEISYGCGLPLQQILSQAQYLGGTCILVGRQNTVTGHVNPQRLLAAA